MSLNVRGLSVSKEEFDQLCRSCQQLEIRLQQLSVVRNTAPNELQRKIQRGNKIYVQ